uniref:ZF(CCHC)-6 zinc finger protein n=1 Tax=Phallusia mammillata TaxID=59560 RepID=A0A6F9DC88_9ASCI|nr:ZF(CCHC)-6 zinc finger protein [Phallusia mammillata]
MGLKHFFDEFRSLHIQITTKQNCRFEEFMAMFYVEGLPLSAYKKMLVACRCVNRRQSIFKITFAEEYTHELSQLHKKFKNGFRYHDDEHYTLILKSFHPPKPLTRLTLFPVPAEFGTRQFATAAEKLDWGIYSKHTFLTYKRYPEVCNGYVHLFLEEAILDNVPIVATIYGHEIQIAKPGESFGPSCKSCMQRGHWTNQCQRREKCKICGEKDHRARDCPWESPVTNSDPATEPESETEKEVDKEAEKAAKKKYRRDYPTIKESEKTSTPKGKMPDQTSAEDLSQVLHQIKVQEDKHNKLFNQNVEVEDPSPPINLDSHSDENQDKSPTTGNSPEVPISSDAHMSQDIQKSTDEPIQETQVEADQAQASEEAFQTELRNKSLTHPDSSSSPKKQHAGNSKEKGAMEKSLTHPDDTPSPPSTYRTPGSARRILPPTPTHKSPISIPSHTPPHTPHPVKLNTALTKVTFDESVPPLESTHSLSAPSEEDEPEEDSLDEAERKSPRPQDFLKDNNSKQKRSNSSSTEKPKKKRKKGRR